LAKIRTKTFVGFTGTTFSLTEWLESQGFSAFQIVISFLFMFIALGSFMEGFAILVRYFSSEYYV